MKAWIGATFPVGIIDMESYWVSEVAVAHGIRHMIVRSVLDPLEQTLPAFVGKAVDDESKRRWTHAVRYLATNPTHMPRLVRLAMQTRVARASLGRFLGGLAPSDAQ